MPTDYDFSRKVQLSLQRDEAIVLLWCLTRELWRDSPGGLQASFANEAESHAFEGLLQESIPPLADTGGQDADEIHGAAVRQLAARFQTEEG